ncbi:MAG: hypothetical protein R2707_05105 [Acidimicrobiales bacterium]
MSEVLAGQADGELSEVKLEYPLPSNQDVESLTSLLPDAGDSDAVLFLMDPARLIEGFDEPSVYVLTGYEGALMESHSSDPLHEHTGEEDHSHGQTGNLLVLGEHSGESRIFSHASLGELVEEIVGLAAAN